MFSEPMIQYLIRAATAADSAGIAAVQITSYRSAYAGLFAKQYLDRFTLEEQTQDWRELLSPEDHDPVLVVETTEGEIIGYALGRCPVPDQPAFDGELVAFHVLAPYQRQGIGNRLFGVMAQALNARGARSLMLWTLKANPVRRYYEQLGGELLGDKEYDVEDSRVTEVAYGWRDLDRLMERLASR